jgi:hypothetical protein
MDYSSYTAMSQKINDHRTQHDGDEPLWTDAAYGGFPAYQVSMKNPGNWFRQLKKSIPRPFSFLLVAFLGGYILANVLGANSWLSFAAGLAYGFNTYLITFIEAGHNTKVEAVGWMPFVIAGLYLLFRGRWLAGIALTALGMAMEVTVNHLQITYYLLLTIGVWGLSELIFAIRDGRVKQWATAAAIMAGISGLAFGLNAATILTTAEYSEASIRGSSELTPLENANSQGAETGLDVGYAFSWSYGVRESLTLLFPNYQGGGSRNNLMYDVHAQEFKQDTKTFQSFRAMAANMDQGTQNQLIQMASAYWGNLAVTSGPIYVGAVIFFLAMLGLVLVPGRMKWWLLAATLMSFVLGWGRHAGINFFLFEYLPLYNKFRTPMMAFVIADLTLVVLAVLGLKELFSEAIDWQKKKQGLFIAGGIVLFLALIALLVGVAYEPLSEREATIMQGNPQLLPLFDAMQSDRISMIRMDVLRSLAFIAAAFGFCWFYGQKEKVPTYAFAIIPLLIGIDLISVNTTYLNSSNFVEADHYSRTLGQQLPPKINDPDPHYRVYNTNIRLDQDGVTSFRFNSLGGYHGAKLKKFQEMVDRHTQGGYRPPSWMLDMFNVKYLITRQNQLVPNPAALGNAWYIEEILWTENADQTMEQLGKFTPARQVIIRETYRDQLSDFKISSPQGSSISLSNYKMNELTYQVNNQSEQFAVFSEVYYRGNEDWNAYIDGEKVEHLPVNYLLRGMKLPAGNYELVFKFEPQSYRSGVSISMVCSILFVLIFLGTGYAGFRKSSQQDAA